MSAFDERSFPQDKDHGLKFLNVRIKIHKNELIISFLLVLITLLFPSDYYLYLLPIILIIALLLLYKEKFVFIFTIITFLTATSALGLSVRTLVQVMNIILLGYYFLKHNGLNFKEYPHVPVLLGLYISALLFLMLISSINSNLMLGLEQIFRLTVFLIITYFYYSLVNYEKGYSLIIKSLYLIAIIYGAYLIYEFAAEGFNIIQYNLKTVTAVGNDYLNKNQMGGFFSVILTLTFSYFFYFKQKKYKYFLPGIVILSAISLILLNSRSSVITAIIGLIFISYFYNKKLIKWTIIVLLFSSLLLFISPVYDLVEIYFRLDSLSTGRDFILKAVSNVIRDNWVLGAGPAGTKYALYKDLPFMLNSPAEHFLRFHYNEIELGHAHNFYLFFFSDLGIIGFILSLLLPVLFFYYGIKTAKKIDKQSLEYYTIMGVLGGGLGLFIRGLFEWGSLISYGTLNLDLPFWLLFIIIIYSYTHSNEPKKKY